MANTAKVVAVVTVVANAAVVDKLACATESAQTADHFAREAAKVAAATDYLTTKDKAERLTAILALYKASLVHQTVKASFNAALSILVMAEPVRLAVAGKTEKFSERLDAEGNKTGETKTTLKLDAMDVLQGKEIAAPEKAVVTLSPMEAVDQLQSNAMKAVATAVRPETVGRAKGAGRPAKAITPARAGFMEELVAGLKDSAISMNMFGIISIAAKNQPHLVAHCKAICEQAGYTVKKETKTVKG